MKVLKLLPKDLSQIVAEKEVVGFGCYGIIYKLDENTLFKFNYKEFIACFKQEDRKIDWKKLGDISEIVAAYKEIGGDNLIKEKMTKLISKQENVKLTKLTKGMVFVQDYCVGFLLHYHKDMCNLYDYLKTHNLSEKDKEIIAKSTRSAVMELLDNDIYTSDLTTKNILYKPSTNEIQLIDFEDVMTSCRENAPKYLRDDVEEKLERLECFIIDSKTKEFERNK